MTQKDLKVVNLEELEAGQEINNPKDSMEEVVDAKISLDDLDKKESKKFLSVENKVIKRVESEVVSKSIDSSIVKSERFKKYKGNGSKDSVVSFMTNRYQFDKREYIKVRVFLFLLIIGSGYGSKLYQDEYLALKMKIGFFNTPVFAIFFDFLELFMSNYVFVAILFLFIFPLKRNTHSLVEIFYDGLYVPSEIFPLGRPKRQRIMWAEVAHVRMQNRFNIPFIQLINQKKVVLGEMRLDLDDMEKFYETLDTYCPQNHPLRILFNNSKKN
jgi:hypothetical protein